MVSAEEFLNPPVKYRIKPFWFWNGEITEEEIRHQIEEMADKGLGGMYICPRQGMTVPYLSEEWFKLVTFACREARRCGLEAWLYDEYPYPSGMSGGEVLLEHPDAEHKVLKHKALTVKGGEKVSLVLGWGRVRFARAFRQREDGTTDWEDFLDCRDCIGSLQTEKIYQETGLTKYNHKRFFSYGPQKVMSLRLPEGSWRIEVYYEEALGDFKYYGGFFDPCRRDAVKTFLDTTHERYDRALGKEFGKTIFGMFSDEVGLLSPIPWSPLLPEAFEKRNGYSILECFPALHDDTVDSALRIRYDFYETVHELFRESYHKQVSDWCKDHNLIYATEVPSMRHTTQRYSDVIGGDTAHEKLGKPLDWIYSEYLPNYRSNAKAVSSLARQLDKPYAMIESFHSVGWTMTLQDAKWMVDRLGSSGISLYNFHAFYYTIQDITKHDAPPSQFLQNPYWKHYRKLADYVGRMGLLVSNTEADIKIAVLDPAAALWTKLGDPFHGFPYRGESDQERKECDFIRDSWVAVCKSLLFGQLDYDHLDAELLREARIEHGNISIGRAAYKVVVLPPCPCMEKEARERLKEFVCQGGFLISVGMLPEKSIDKGESDEETKKQWNRLFSMENTSRTTLEREDLVKICRSHMEETVHVTVTEGNPRDVIAVTRLEKGKENKSYVFVSNQGGSPVSVRIKPRVWQFFQTEWLDLESGNIVPAENGGENGLLLSLEGFESRYLRLFEIKKEKIETEKMEPGSSEIMKTVKDLAERGMPLHQEVFTISMRGLLSCRPEGENLCRFAHVEVSLDGMVWKMAETKTFIEQCAEAGLLNHENLRMEGSFGTPRKIRPAYPLTCWYKIKFESELIPEEIELFMDRETIKGDWELWVNGWTVAVGAFKPVRVNDQNNCFADIRSLVKTGENEILICCMVRKDEDGLRAPIYLRGSFGVFGNGTKTGMRLTQKPLKTCLDAAWPKGFPYFSGTMEYEKTFTLTELTNKRNMEWKTEEETTIDSLPMEFGLRLGMDHVSYDCLEVLINGTSLGVKAYTPYQWNCKRSLLKEGENHLRLRVSNTLANMLDGTYFDYKAHQLVPVKPEKGES